MNQTKTSYMGFELKNPLIISACSLTRELDKVKEMEDYGASAVVLPSLFEEEINSDKEYIETYIDQSTGNSAEAFNYFVAPLTYKNLEGEDYLENLHKIKSAVHIPVMGSLNGVGLGGWTKYAKLMQEAGADGIELNIFYIPTNHLQSSLEIENRYLEVVKKVKSEVSIPLAIKLNPYFSSLANMATKLDLAGADALVLFNRFLEPDINLETLNIDPKIELSSALEMRLPLHWTAILYHKIQASICAGRGVKNAEQMIKLIMAGADTVGIASVLYQKGVPYIKTMLEDARQWMDSHEYESFLQMRGSMSYNNLADPSQLERLNYMKTIKTFMKEYS
jgi:dihydroorotate dehydrogenase (fumarate)